jgi:hypothetical protein
MLHVLQFVVPLLLVHQEIALISKILLTLRQRKTSKIILFGAKRRKHNFFHKKNRTLRPALQKINHALSRLLILIFAGSYFILLIFLISPKNGKNQGKQNKVLLLNV